MNTINNELHEYWVQFDLPVRAHNVLLRAKVKDVEDLRNHLLKGSYMGWKNCGLKTRAHLYQFILSQR